MATTTPITLVGNIAHEPQFSEAGGFPKLIFSVACEHRFQKNGEWESKPSFINVVVWRQTAERAAGLLEKGLSVMVEGRLDQRSWENDEGEKRSTVEVVADAIAINVWGIDSFVRRAKGPIGGGSSKPKAKPDAPTDDPW